MGPKISDHLFHGHFVSGSGGLGTRLAHSTCMCVCAAIAAVCIMFCRSLHLAIAIA